jgi:hypothetical protein
MFGKEGFRRMNEGDKTTGCGRLPSPKRLKRSPGSLAFLEERQVTVLIQ